MQNYRRHTKIRSACLAGALRKCKLLATLQSLRWRTHDCRCCSSPIFALSKGIAKAMVWHRHLWLTSAKTVSGHMFYPCRLDPSKMFGQGLKSIQALFFTFLIMWWKKKQDVEYLSRHFTGIWQSHVSNSILRHLSNCIPQICTAQWPSSMSVYKYLWKENIPNTQY